MIVKKLILYKYKRFFLTKIDKLEYTPNKPMQVILGTNGSGKSQLLRQLNPLPANLKQEFYDTGYKYIEILHNNTIYTLSSGYVGTNKHSFIVNEEELNPGGTRKVQLELVKEHFSITPEIIEILLNNNRLTIMSPMERKKWLSELSNVDYTYAISVYNKLRQRHRDLVGGIKLLNDELIKSESNNLDKDHIEKLKLDKEHLTEYYNHIISLYQHDNNQVDVNMDMLSNIIVTMKSELTKMDNYNIDKLHTEYEQLSTTLTKVNTKLETITTELKNMEKIHQYDNIDKIKEKYEQLHSIIESLTTKNYHNLPIENIEYYYNKYSNIHSSIVSILNEFTNYDDIRRLTPEEVKEKINREEELINKDRVINTKINLLTNEYNHIQKHKSEDYKVECPECKHNWYMGYDANKIKELDTELNKLKELLTKVRTEREHLNTVINKIKTVDDIKVRLKEVIKSNWELKPVFEHYLNKFNINTSSILEMVTVFDNINIYLNNIKNLTRYSIEIKKCEDTIRNYEEVIKLNKDYNNTKEEQLVKELEELTIKKNSLEKDIVLVKSSIHRYDKIVNYYNQLKSMLSKLKSYAKYQIVKERNSHLSELASYVKSEIVTLDNTLTEAMQYESKYKKDKMLLDEYKQKEKVLRYMVKELSPNEGLIAKSINSFLNVFVMEMNAVINKIWSYEIELMTCDITEEDDLDYKFKVRVNNDEIIEDVSKLSTSMKEIIDLAFRLVFVKYMKLVDVPLILDEFSSSFDERHRIQAFTTIDKILSSDYPQVFLVSHFENSYGSLSNCEFNIINSNNIELDNLNEYNKNMKIS